MPGRWRPDPSALAQARQLLRAHGHRLEPTERRLLEDLLARLERGSATRGEVLAALTRSLRERGLSAEEALRRLRATPYYRLLERLLPPD